MIGCVIGVGHWEEVAHAAAQRMSRMTGLRVAVITIPNAHFDHPSWLKSTIMDRPEFESEDSFLVFDADIVCVRKWNPQLIFDLMGRAFCAVPEPDTDLVYDECENIGVSYPGVYVNGGLLMFGREHQAIWDLVKLKHPKCGKHGWHEQSALNLALVHKGVEVCRLPKRFNVVTYRGDVERYHGPDMRVKSINIHFTSLNGPRELRQIQESYGMCVAPREPATAT